MKAVLFDLDGTLLPMNNDYFVEYYFGLLCKKLAPYGYESKKLIDAIWTGTAAMIRNDGSKTNEDVFWDTFIGIMGENSLKDKALFEDFYQNEFIGAKAVCGYDEKLVELVRNLKKKGYTLILATNPVFPITAVYHRIHWAGLNPEDFELYTSYENIGYCKPNPLYYQEILNRCGLDAKDCIMVGNDAHEDMIAETLGMKVFLLTNNLINRKNTDISKFDKGNTDDLIKYMERL